MPPHYRLKREVQAAHGRAHPRLREGSSPTAPQGANPLVPEPASMAREKSSMGFPASASDKHEMPGLQALPRQVTEPRAAARNQRMAPRSRSFSLPSGLASPSLHEASTATMRQIPEDDVEAVVPQPSASPVAARPVDGTMPPRPTGRSRSKSMTTPRLPEPTAERSGSPTKLTEQQEADLEGARDEIRAMQEKTSKQKYSELKSLAKEELKRKRHIPRPVGSAWVAMNLGTRVLYQSAISSVKDSAALAVISTVGKDKGKQKADALDDVASTSGLLSEAGSTGVDEGEAPSANGLGERLGKWAVEVRKSKKSGLERVVQNFNAAPLPKPKGNKEYRHAQREEFVMRRARQLDEMDLDDIDKLAEEEWKAKAKKFSQAVDAMDVPLHAGTSAKVESVDTEAPAEDGLLGDPFADRASLEAFHLEDREANRCDDLRDDASWHPMSEEGGGPGIRSFSPESLAETEAQQVPDIPPTASRLASAWDRLSADRPLYQQEGASSIYSTPFDDVSGEPAPPGTDEEVNPLPVEKRPPSRHDSVMED